MKYMCYLSLVKLLRNQAPECMQYILLSETRMRKKPSHIVNWCCQTVWLATEDAYGIVGG